MAANQVMVIHSHTPNESLLGYSPRDVYTPESDTLDSWQSALDTVPDPLETTLRVRLNAKAEVMKALVEERIARANNTKVQQHQMKDFIPNETTVDLYRVPEKKDEIGWRGPCQLVHISSDGATAIVIHQSQPYIVPTRHIRHHVGYVSHCLVSGGNFSGNTEQVNELFKLFDTVDGSSFYKVFQLGRIMSDDDQWQYCPAELETHTSDVLELARTVVSQVLNVEHIDGIIYGTKVKRLHAVHKATYGLLVMWCRNNRKDYKIMEVDPSVVTHVCNLLGSKWLDFSCLLFYSYVRPYDDEGRLPYIIPPLEDISAIDLDPGFDSDGSMLDTFPWTDDSTNVEMSGPSGPPAPPAPPAPLPQPTTVVPNPIEIAIPDLDMSIPPATDASRERSPRRTGERHVHFDPVPDVQQNQPEQEQSSITVDAITP